MPDDKSTEPSSPVSAPDSGSSSLSVPAESAPQLPPPQTDTPSPAPTDRAELLNRARAFLITPQVQHEDTAAKRRFLADKGLTEREIDGLLYDTPAPAPAVPPRTYPQLPPSKVPYLLLNVFRAFTWIAGGSAALLIAYFRFLYPRIAQTYHARVSLRAHRSSLLARLTHNLEELKATQRATFAVLPQPDPIREPAQYATCASLDDLVEVSQGSRDVPSQSLLRCAILESSKTGQKATSAELFNLLETKFPWVSEEGSQYEDILWQTLTTTAVFQPAPPPPSTRPSDPPSPSLPPATPPTSSTVWTYVPPSPPPPPPLVTSLTSLSIALPPPRPEQPPPAPKFQHTLQALSDLTGYIATQTYALPQGLYPGAPPRAGTGIGGGSGAALTPEEEEVRREIRALKGLVLNRRSFMPRVSRPDPPSLPVGVAVGGASSG